MDSSLDSLLNWEGNQNLVTLSLSSIPNEHIDACNWSDELHEDCQRLDSLKIQQICKQSKSFEEGIQKIIPLVVDFLFRKQNIKNILLKFAEHISENQSIQSCKELSQIKISDLLFALFLKVQDKPLIGDLILKAGIPLQIYYRTQKYQKYLPDLLDRSDDPDNASFIFYAGSESVPEEEKIGCLCKIFGLEDDYRTEHEGLIGEQSLLIHRINRQNYVFDFTKDVLNIPQLLHEYANRCQFVILRVKLSQIYSSEKKIMIQKFGTSIKKVFKNKKIVMITNGNKTQVNELNKMEDSSFYFISLGSNIKQQIGLFIKQQGIKFSFSKKSTHSLTSKSQSPIEAKVQQVFRVLPITKQIFSFKTDFFPYSKVCDQIYELEKQIQEMRQKVPCQSEELQKLDLIKIQQMKTELSEKLCLLKADKRNEMIREPCHKFVGQIFQLIRSNANTTSMIHILRKNIFKWKGEIIELTKSKISQSSICSSNSEKSQEKSQLNQSLLEQDFLFSNVLNEFLLMNESEYQQKHVQTDETKLILKLYHECLREMIPINLVDRTSLRFGNTFLKQFFTLISKQNCYENKKIYVISVIGAQSTGKSTLINYLFRTKFQTSSGRCTKGMYFNIVECEDRILFLIDTEGLLSLDNNDYLFDNQIATFILSISNLVIINTSGQINMQQKDMLYICMHAMKYLRGEKVMQQKNVRVPRLFQEFSSEQEEESQKPSQSKQKPQKIVFAIQKQTQSNKTPHESALEKIKTYFKKEEQQNINFEEFFDLQVNDFFSFPPAFGPSGHPFYFEKATEKFGDCLRGFRSRIIKILDEGQNYKSSLKNFYEECEYCWKAILRSGPNLMNYKYKFELQIKIAIKKKYQALEEEQKNGLQDKLKYKQIYETKKISEIDSIFEGIRIEWQSSFKSKVKEETAHLKPQQKWYERCFFQINSQGWSIKNFTLRKIKVHLSNLEKEKRQREYQRIYKGLISKILKEQKDEGKILKLLEEHKEEEDRKIVRNFNIIDIEYQIISEISSYFQKNQPIEDYLKYYARVKHLLQKGDYQQLQSQLFNLAEKQKPCFQGNLENPILQLFQYTKGFLEISQQIKCLESFGEKSKREKTKPLLIDLFKAAYLEVQKFSQRHSLRALKSLESFQIRSLMRGLLVSFIAQKRHKLLIENESIKENQQNYFFRKWTLHLQCAFDNRKNGYEIALDWSKRIKQQVKEQVQKEIEQQIQEKLEDLPRKLSHKDLVKNALDSSFLSKNCDKNNLKQCFKFILFPEKFYFDTFCNTKHIQELQKMIKDCIQKGHQKAQTQIKLLQETIKQGSGLSKAKIEQIMSKYGLFNLLQKQGGTMAEVVTNTYVFGVIIKQEYLHKQCFEKQVLDSQLMAHTKRSLQEVIFPEILGCLAKCPFCGIKCTLPKGHRGDHEVPSDWHLLKAFNGILDIENSLPSCYSCLSQYEVLARRYKIKDANKKDTYNDVSTLSYLQSMPQEQKWTGYFKQKIKCHEFQQKGTANELKKVWGKIERMVRKYKQSYLDGEPSSKASINELNEADLDEIFYDGFNGDKTSFRSCLS